MKIYKLITYSFCLLFVITSRAQMTVDTNYVYRLKEVKIIDKRKWLNDTARYYFNQTRYHVQTILPYLNAATNAFNEMNEQLNKTNISKRKRRKMIEVKENDLRNQFEEKVKALNETQGVLLVKLIARQTGLNIYSILQEFKNPFTAFKWLAWARVNGFNLNKKYNPNDEVLLEQVMLSLDYPLPDFYFQKENITVFK